MCTECYAKNPRAVGGNVQNSLSATSGGDVGYGRGWVYGYRTRYYSSYDYYPTYWGSDPYWHSYDRRSFDSGSSQSNWTGSAGTAGNQLGAAGTDDMQDMANDFSDSGGDWYDS